MPRLLTAALIAAALILPSTANAWQTLPGANEIFNDQLTPQWRKAKPLHPVWEAFTDVKAIPIVCGLTPNAIDRFYGCAFTTKDTCWVYIANGLTDAQRDVVERHERAHCAGFHHPPVNK